MTTAEIYRSPAAAATVTGAYAALVDALLPGIEQHRLPTPLGPTTVLSVGPPTAPPVLLLHGSGSTAVSWLAELRGLSDRYRVHAVELVGEVGRSAAVRPPLDGDVYADWLTGVTDALRTPAAAVVGLSLGGWLALDYAVRRPERVQRLVLFSASGIGSRRLRPLLVAALLGTLGDPGRRRAYRRLVGAVPTTAEGRALEDFAVLTFKAFRPRTDPIPTFTDDQLAALRVPVAAVFGAEDALLDGPGAAVRLRALLPAAQVELAEHAGHLVPGRYDRIAVALSPVDESRL